MSQLTAESMREAFMRLKKQPTLPEYRILVHPLRSILLDRNCDPVYCPYFGIRLSKEWSGLYEQTQADFSGWGINGF